MLFSVVQQNVIAYAAREVVRQDADPLAVEGMLQAWNYCAMHAKYGQARPSEYDAMVIASVIDSANLLDTETCDDNYRQIPATFALGGNAVQAQLIPAATLRLFSQLPGLELSEADAWCKALLQIHPWKDGNGRTVSLLRNWILGKLLSPEPLPYYEF